LWSIWYLLEKKEFINNLKILLTKESKNGGVTIALKDFSGFLARFGPIKLMRNKIDSFVVYKTSASYYGSISADRASQILLEHFGRYQIPACLYRNTLPQYTVGEPIIPVFSVSWIIGGGVQHLRIHVDPFGYLCFREESNNVVHGRRITLWSDIMMKVKDVKKINPTMTFIAVETNEYSGLVGEEYIEIRSMPNIGFPYNLSDIDNDVRFFGFNDTL